MVSINLYRFAFCRKIIHWHIVLLKVSIKRYLKKSFIVGLVTRKSIYLVVHRPLEKRNNFVRTRYLFGTILKKEISP